MARVLHLIKDPANRTALDVIRAQASDPALSVSVVLMHDAVRLEDPLPDSVYRLRSEDAPPDSTPATIDASQLLDLIFAADSVVSW